uniref:Uncharacterized protein n=1 Tax=Shewanella putrefaciens (strain 200) TaxID=399804 RepID=E6XGY2_SHEP2
MSNPLDIFVFNLFSTLATYLMFGLFTVGASLIIFKVAYFNIVLSAYKSFLSSTNN